MPEGRSGEAREALETWKNRLLTGPWSGLDHELAQAQRAAVAERRPFVAHGLTNVRLELAILQARPGPPPPPVPPAGPVQQARAEVLRLRLQLRAGVTDPDAIRSACAEAQRYERSGLLGGLLAAELALRTGAVAAATAQLEALAAPGSADSPRAGWEAAELAIDAALLGGDRARAVELAGQLRGGARGASERLAGAADLADLLASDDPTDRLRRLARRRDEGLPAARRAAHLLGEDAALDALDALVVQALAQRWGRPCSPRVVAPRAAAPALRLDVRRGRVQLDGGAEVDLSSRPQLVQILHTMVQHGGVATKEQLVHGVWGLRTYAPLRDDNRLQVAVGRLRRVLGAGVVVACEGGYRLSVVGELAALP